MAKNIVLCSDGTGNSGGKGKGTNVWRIYQAIDRNSARRDQIAFYDDGVGTEENKYLKLIGGAVGAGFTRNVKDLYKTLVKNHTAGDDIYMFGFSRGAYTVRALAAFVAKSGVITNARAMTERDLDDSIERLIGAYWRRTDDQTDVTVTCTKTAPTKIKCVGVWDTVSAIGLPFDILLEQVILQFFKFEFSDQHLSPRVEYGFHALAIDEERLTFHPVTWNAREGVEQVWFAGVHSNVGGGYPKQGMAYITLDWMMKMVAYDNAKGWGLDFDAGLRAQARQFANVHNKLYDSRAGVAAYYRYAPRDIEDLTPSNGAVMVHDSVFDRIEAKTLAYNPGSIPSNRDIDIVTNTGAPPNPARQARVTAQRAQRGQILGGARRWINARKSLHLAFILFSMLVAAAALHLGVPHLLPEWATVYAVPVFFGVIILVIMVTMPRIRYFVLCVAAAAAFAVFALGPQSWFGGPITLPGWINELLAFVLPDLLADLIVQFIAGYPYGAAAVVVVAGVIVTLKGIFRKNAARIFERGCDTLRP